MQLRRILCCLLLFPAAAALAQGTPPGAAAKSADQDFPRRQVSIVHQFSPGIGGDTLARIIAPHLGDLWKQPVVVESRPGASGTIAAGMVAKAPPDGHVMLLMANTYTMMPSLFKNLMQFDPENDFAAVGMLAVTSYVLAVNPERVAAQDLDHFIADVKAGPGKYGYASPGNGTPMHLGSEIFKLRLGLDILNVPYKGSAGAITDLVGGRVQMMFTTIPTGLPHIRSGRLRALAVTGARRSPQLPGVPTFRERGMDYMDSIDGWYGILVPARTTAATIARIHQDFEKVLQRQDVQEALARQAITPAVSAPEKFAGVVKSDIALWRRLIAEMKIPAE